MIIYSAAGPAAQARELLALAVQETWGLSPLPEVGRRAGGKPFFLEHEELHFNLSHSGNLVLCALDREPVGADIQIVKQWRPALPGRVCSTAELEWLEKQPELWPAFTLLWALKEARAKESGRGLTSSIRNIRIPLPGEGGCPAGRTVVPDLDWSGLGGGGVRTQPAPGNNFRKRA